MKKRVSALLAMAAMLAGACGSPTDGLGPGPDPQAKLGILQWSTQRSTSGGDDITAGKPNTDPNKWSDAPITLPARMRAGEPFEVVVRTIGPNGCWKPGDTDVTYRSTDVLVTPYDLHSGAEACTEVLGYLPHRFQLKIDKPGEVVLRVEGRQVVNGRVTDAAPAVMTHRLSIE